MGTRRLFVAALLVFGAGLVQAGAQTYPNQTIKIVVPFSAGGPVDSLARVMVQYLQEKLGQNVIVENRTGGGTSIGAKSVAAAAPDGYTLLFIGPNLAYYPVLFPDLDFDPLKALSPVATAVTWSHVLAVAPSVPANTIPELVAYAKANPGKLVFGFGLATMPHIIGETFKQAAGIELTNLPYRGGEQARADLLGGRVHINVAPVPQLDAAYPGRQDAAARLYRAQTQPRPAGRADHDRKRTIRRSASIRTSGWAFFAPAGTPPADRRAAQSRHQRRDAVRRDGAGAQAFRLRGEDQRRRRSSRRSLLRNYASGRRS